jgi:hypothetical protein
MPGVNGEAMVRALRGALGAADADACAFYLYTSDPTVAPKFASLGFDGSFLKRGDGDMLAGQVDAAFRTIKMRRLAQEMRKQRHGK